MKLYLFYTYIWGDFGQGVEGKELSGAIIARDEDSAIWASKIAKISYDRIESINPLDEDSTIFKVDD